MFDVHKNGNNNVTLSLFLWEKLTAFSRKGHIITNAFVKDN